MSFWRLYYHLVWATKNREPLIEPGVEPRLHAYLVRKAAELGVHVYAVSSCVDHVHMVVAIPPKHAVAYVVKNLKGASSYDLNSLCHGAGMFAWQRGYGALSLGERQLPVATAYLQKQKEHHQQQTTNAWLECYAEFDEGPSDSGLAPESVPGLVREARSSYWADGGPPF
ncbi:MAG: IS200/IS605 family transposase [Anaerolineae bacterium]|nr:IS200/IS605 family transposase [Anaerolineae bacterium]MDX9830304.1 IS200/IS605 family transposase [Anaerolineae bacterium]